MADGLFDERILMDLGRMENGKRVAAIQCPIFARHNLVNRILT